MQPANRPASQPAIVSRNANHRRLPAGLIGNTVTLPRVTPDGGGGTVILAEMGTNVLEFATISRITGAPLYREQAEKGLRAVHAANPNVRPPSAFFQCQQRLLARGCPAATQRHAPF